ncbi:MAG: N-acetylneuraminate synthase family protein [Planctomycetota bacterium]
MNIAGRAIGPGQTPYVIAEIGVNHDGEVDRALMLTEAAADAGADAVKLQLFETDRLMSKASKLAAYQKAAGETDPLAMLRRLELSIDQMAPVVDRAHERGIHAVVSVFSVELVEVAERLAWDAYKTASPDIINKPLLDAIAATGKPMVVSTGASDLSEVTRASDWLVHARSRLAFLQCVSSYPAPTEALGGIRAIAQATLLPTGYSDHTSSDYTSFAATAAGACLLEKHITDDPDRSGPDHKASLPLSSMNVYMSNARKGAHARAAWTEVADNFGPTDLRKLLKNKDLAHLVQQLTPLALSDAVQSKPEKPILDCERDVREVSRQSLVTTRDLAPGDVITRADLTIKRPGTGLPPFKLDDVVGVTVKQTVEADMPLTADDLT